LASVLNPWEPVAGWPLAEPPAAGGFFDPLGLIRRRGSRRPISCAPRRSRIGANRTPRWLQYSSLVGTGLGRLWLSPQPIGPGLHHGQLNAPQPHRDYIHPRWLLAERPKRGGGPTRGRHIWRPPTHKSPRLITEAHGSRTSGTVACQLESWTSATFPLCGLLVCRQPVGPPKALYCSTSVWCVPGRPKRGGGPTSGRHIRRPPTHKPPKSITGAHGLPYKWYSTPSARVMDLGHLSVGGLLMVSPAGRPPPGTML
jgi:hypothetical protein